MNLTKMLKSFKYAIKGIKYMILKENNFKFHLLATVLVMGLGLYCKISANSWIAILLCCALVLSLETINTAIEKLVDLVSPEQNPKAGLIKDVAAAAVLIAAIFSVCVAVVVLLSELGFVGF
jgi:diacylglycerol kinase